MLNFHKWIKNWFINNWFNTLVYFVCNFLLLYKPLGSNWLRIVFYIVVFVVDIIYIFVMLKDLRNQLRFFKTMKQSPLTYVIGALGTGKTMLMSHYIINSKYEDKFSNYPVLDNNVAVGGMDMLDFKNFKIPLPYSDSNLVVLDEMGLYIDANNYKGNIAKSWGGTIPTFILARQMSINLVFVAQREGHHWVEYRELATGMLVPLNLKRPLVLKGIFRCLVWIFPKFKIQVGFFDDQDNYTIWKQESVKRSANGKKVKLKNAAAIGMQHFKFQISLLDVMQYDTKFLAFVRNLKNDFVVDKSLTYWDTLDLNDVKNIEKMGLRRLQKELGVDK